MYAIFGPLLKFECAFADKLFHFHFTLKTFYSFYLNKYLNDLNQIGLISVRITVFKISSHALRM